MIDFDFTRFKENPPVDVDQRLEEAVKCLQSDLFLTFLWLHYQKMDIMRCERGYERPKDDFSSGAFRAILSPGIRNDILDIWYDRKEAQGWWTDLQHWFSHSRIKSFCDNKKSTDDEEVLEHWVTAPGSKSVRGFLQCKKDMIDKAIEEGVKDVRPFDTAYVNGRLQALSYDWRDFANELEFHLPASFSSKVENKVKQLPQILTL